MSAVENIHIVGKDNGTEGGAGEPRPEAVPSEAVDKTSRDMGKVALFIAILAVVLLVVFFFGLNRNLTGLSAKVDGLATLKTDVEALDGRMGVAEERLVALETLPAKARKMVMGTMLQEMAQRTAYLGTQMDTEAQNEKLHRAMELLQQVQMEVAKEAEMVVPVPAAPAETPAQPEAVAPAAEEAPAQPEAVAPAVEEAPAQPEAAAPAKAEATVEQSEAVPAAPEAAPEEAPAASEEAPAAAPAQ